MTQALIDNCDVATSWSATRNGVPDTATTFWEAGAVGVAELDSAVTSPEVWTLTRTGSISFAMLPYLVAEVKHISINSSELGVTATTSVGLLSLPILSRRSVGSNGYHEVICLIPAGATLTSVTFRHVSAPREPWQGLFVGKLSQTNMPSGTSARQLSRLIEAEEPSGPPRHSTRAPRAASLARRSSTRCPSTVRATPRTWVVGARPATP